MPNIAAIFKQEISRLARKEARTATLGLRKATAQYRRDIARLKRNASTLEGELARLRRQFGKPATPVAAPAEGEKLRFTAKGLQSHRGRVGLSAADYGRLVGVTGQTIYKWEHGGARPRRQQLASLATLRGIGKKEATARLEKLAATPARGRRKKK